MSKNSKRVMKSQRKKKLFAVEQFGGKCQICGYDKCINALSFHHTDSSTKKYSPSFIIMRWSWERAFEELKKCILVCSNCHAEIHYQDLNIESMLIQLPVFELTCLVCNRKFETKRVEQQYCSIKCMSVSNRKVKNRPTKSELEVLITKYNWTQLGKMFDVSDNAVRKWAKNYKLL